MLNITSDLLKLNFTRGNYSTQYILKKEYQITLPIDGNKKIIKISK